MPNYSYDTALLPIGWICKSYIYIFMNINENITIKRYIKEKRGINSQLLNFSTANCTRVANMVLN